MPKNRLQELDEILAKSQRLSSHVSDGGSAARQLNYRVSPSQGWMAIFATAATAAAVTLLNPFALCGVGGGVERVNTAAGRKLSSECRAGPDGDDDDGLSSSGH